jgi:hypothetical protein
MPHDTITIRVRPEIRQAIDEILLHKLQAGERLSLNRLLTEWIEAKVQEAYLQAHGER